MLPPFALLHDSVKRHPSFKLRCRTHAPPLAAKKQKRKVLKYEFLASLCETISLERLPLSAGGGCDPTQATSDQVQDFVVCGRVAEVPGGAGADKEGSSGGSGGADEESGGAITPAAEAELDQAFSVGNTLQSAGKGGAADGGALAAAAAIASSIGGGDSTTTSSTHKSGGSDKPHVTFRSLFERLQARDEPSSTAAVKRQHQQRRSASPPPSQASSFQDHSSVSASSPPLSRQGSSASLVGGSGRPFASPGPDRIRRSSTVGVGTGEVASGGERSPGQEDEQAEDFDSRLVGRALRLSMKRKVNFVGFSNFFFAGGGGCMVVVVAWRVGGRF